jgi:hypothetical protein
MNFREGQLAYYDVLSDKPQPMSRLYGGMFNMKPLVEKGFKSGLLASQGTLFFDEGEIVFRSDMKGDPILKYEQRVRSK